MNRSYVDASAPKPYRPVPVQPVERGAPLSTTGRTALHLAAGAGEATVVSRLLDRGADPSARDPEYRATPRQWADFLGHPEVAGLLP
jgi:ankyrin repeat protein